MWINRKTTKKKSHFSDQLANGRIYCVYVFVCLFVSVKSDRLVCVNYSVR